MFAALHSDPNDLKSGLFHLTGQPNSKKHIAAKVKDGIISETKFLRKISVNQYKIIKLPICKGLEGFFVKLN
jgi:hypothetical protein